MSFKNLINNIKFMARADLRQYIKQSIDLPQLYDNLVYEIADVVKNQNVKSVLGIMDSLEYLVQSESSIIRFGDGEINLMCGTSIPFQHADTLLATRLKQALSVCDKKLMIGIPSALYKSKTDMEPYARDFWRANGNKFRQTLEQYIDFNKKSYYAAEITLGFSNSCIDKSLYFSKFRSIWANKDIVIVCGDRVFDKITYNIFDNAKSIQYIYTPSTDAFSAYDTILNECLSVKNKIFIVICGPTAKILCHDLFINGKRALDLGHIAKSYDWYKKDKTLDSLHSGENFFAPD